MEWDRKDNIRLVEQLFARPEKPFSISSCGVSPVAMLKAKNKVAARIVVDKGGSSTIEGRVFSGARATKRCFADIKFKR